MRYREQSPIPQLILYTALAIGAVWGIYAVIQAGREERDAEPPRMVVEKSHTIESSTHSCGKNCVSTSNSDVFTLFAEDGGTCRVSRHTFAIVQRGTKHWCDNLFGWRD